MCAPNRLFRTLPSLTSLVGHLVPNPIFSLTAAVVLLATASGAPAFGQLTWYRFDKNFIDSHYSQDGGAIGTLKVSAMHPAKNAHPVSCGGDDGELHMGIAENALGRGLASAFANEHDSNFGMVGEPPNVKNGSPFLKAMEAADGDSAMFFGYFRLWNEGHDRGPTYPSNPHHVLEVHPAWGIRTRSVNYQPRPSTIFSMPGFSGYGASKFVPMLKSVPTWLRVAEDQTSVYVQLQRADNFYQLPVIVRQVRTFESDAGTAALVDVYSDTQHQHMVYQGLTIVTATGENVASRLQANWSTYLLGFFSVNLKKAEAIAAGHGRSGAVPAPGALEFFAFGVPLQKAVSSSRPCTEEDD